MGCPGVPSAVLRHAVAAAARQSGWDEALVNQYVLGHRANPEDVLPRFSYLPVPTIESGSDTGRRNVVDAIRRVLVAEPVGTPAKHVKWLEQIVPGQVVTDVASKPVALLERITADGVLARYVGRGTTWCTTTPVALPGCDEGKASKTDKLLAKMFRHAGHALDALAQLEFQRLPFLRGAEDARRYRPRPPHYLAHCTMYHMRIRWKQPVAGPLALGSGRFCGLGLFAAL